jgi:gluconokinase
VDKGQCAAQFVGMTTKTFPARSPAEKVGGLVYFGRMLDKIRAHAKGELPSDWSANLGKGFDGRCLRFLGLKYEDLVKRVLNGDGTDEEILRWALGHGHNRSEEDMTLWNEFMRKCGWNDEISPTLERRKRESGLEQRDEIQTMFQYIDVDEGRM